MILQNVSLPNQQLQGKAGGGGAACVCFGLCPLWNEQLQETVQFASDCIGEITGDIMNLGDTSMLKVWKHLNGAISNKKQWKTKVFLLFFGALIYDRRINNLDNNNNSSVEPRDTRDKMKGFSSSSSSFTCSFFSCSSSSYNSFVSFSPPHPLSTLLPPALPTFCV